MHLRAVNSARAKAGVGALALDAELSRMAQGHACDMFRHRYFSHAAPDGRDFVHRARG